MIPLRALLRALSIERAAGDLDTPIAEVCYDSRQATPRALFVALRGSYTDGHRYLEDARRRGAVAALVEEWSDALDAYPAAAQVADTRAALARVAAEFFRHPSSSLGVIGVTGTDGKTTTTFLIDAMLRAAGYRTGLVGTVAVRIADQVIEHDTRQTTPESLDLQRLLAAMRREGVQWAVIESTSHGLAMHRLDCCSFDIAVVTNITHEHLDFHGTIEAYRRAKARLLEFVAQRDDGRSYPYGVALNADDEGARSIAGYAGSAPVIWFGLHASQAGVRAQEIRAHAAGTDFELVTPGGSAPVRLKLLGRFNVENALAAAAAGHLLGLTPQQIARGLESLDHVPGRLRRIDAGHVRQRAHDQRASDADAKASCDQLMPDKTLLAIHLSPGAAHQLALFFLAERGKRRNSFGHHLMERQSDAVSCFGQQQRQRFGQIADGVVALLDQPERQLRLLRRPDAKLRRRKRALEAPTGEKIERPGCVFGGRCSEIALERRHLVVGAVRLIQLGV